MTWRERPSASVALRYLRPFTRYAVPDTRTGAPSGRPPGPRADNERNHPVGEWPNG